MINISIFAIAKRHLGSSPVVQEKVVKALLIPLAIADVGVIPLILVELPDTS